MFFLFSPFILSYSRPYALIFLFDKKKLGFNLYNDYMNNEKVDDVGGIYG